MRHANLNAVYIPIRVLPEHLDQFLEDAPKLDIHGVSVTIPHKEAVVGRLTKADRVVLDIDAANTIVYENDRLIGFNTDSRAAIDSLEASLPAYFREPDVLKDKSILILGAGGAAKAVAYAFMRQNADVAIAGRTEARSEDLAERLGCRAIGWAARHRVDCTILVNCTPVGMHPHVDESPIEKHRLKPSMIVMDTVYNPENTLLIKEARSQGCTVVTGIDMFVRQASLQFKLFTQHEAPIDVMRATLKNAISPVKY